MRRVLVGVSVCLLGLSAGCGGGASSRVPAQAPDTSAASDSTTPSTAPFIPPVTPSASRPPAPGLRPMTPGEQNFKRQCEKGRLKDGCEFYTDRSLRLQGIDPGDN